MTAPIDIPGLVAELRGDANGWDIAVADEILIYGDGTEDAIGMAARAEMCRRAADALEASMAREAGLRAALQLAKDMFIANNLSLPHTFEVIDTALKDHPNDR